MVDFVPEFIIFYPLFTHTNEDSYFLSIENN